MAFEKFDIKQRWTTFRDHRASKKAAKSARITSKVIWNLFLIFIIFGLMGAFFAGGVGAGYFASLVKDEPIRPYESMKQDVYNYEETSEVYFANDVYLGKLRSDLEREEIQLENVSDYVIQAVIATEDQYFYEHEGVVPKALFRAIFQEVTNSSVQTGGSTLTQQLIKNQLLTREVSFDRKAKEILLAMRLERFFEKDDILEAYLNIVPFGRNSSGRNIAGVQTAAQGIFGIDASELSLPQAAFIAGLPQSPFGYTPFTNSGNVKENLTPGLNRMQTVLNRMHEAGFITDQELAEASQYDITKDFISKTESPLLQYPYMMQEVERRAIKILAEQMIEEDGVTEEELNANDGELYREYKANADNLIRKGGFKIHTTIDKDIYDAMQEVKNNYTLYGDAKPEKKKDETGEPIKVMEPVETGAIMIENSTGKIISFVGGRDYKKQNLNHATQALRSNGSTMKPLLVYAPGMEVGAIQPGTVLADVPGRIPGWPAGKPGNYGGGYHGLTSVRYALAKSYNIPAAKAYARIIGQQPAQYLEKMGFTSLTKEDKVNASASLGGIAYGVTVEENVNAYATFANGGKFIDAYMIDKIETKDGETVYQHEVDPVDVFSPQTAYLTIDVMRDVLKYGTAASTPKRLKFYADWAGKTGTSQDYRDAWFVATNPNITFGTWIGYDTPKRLQKSYKGYSYSNRNTKLWAELMNAAYDIRPELVKPKQSFKMPGGIVRRSYCAVSGLLPSSICSELGLVESDLFNVKYVPKKTDDTLQLVNYIVRNDEKFIVPENAPSEFVKQGLMIKPEFLEEQGLEAVKELDKLIPNSSKWENLLAPITKEIADNGKAPDALGGVKMSGKSISWSLPGESDVIGYRVYQAANRSSSYHRIANIPANVLSYITPSTSAVYYITAVDVSGKESAPSVIVGAPEPPKEPEEPKPPKPDEPKPPKPDEPKPPKPDEPPTEPGDGDETDPPPAEGDGDTPPTEGGTDGTNSSNNDA